VSFASDVYSLGIVLYEMLVGSPPCAGDSYFKVIHRHLEGKLPDLAAAGPGIPREIGAQAVGRGEAGTFADQHQDQPRGES